MPRKRSTPPSELGHSWYLAEWADHFGRKQADAQRDLGWSRSTTSDLWNGKQRYTQDYVDIAAQWLGIEPFEILLAPRDAIALRSLRRYAQEIAQGFPREPSPS